MAEEGLFGGGETDQSDDLDRLGWEGWAILLVVPAGLAAVLLLITAQGVFIDSVGRVSREGGGASAIDPTRLVIGLGLGLLFLVAALLLARHEDEG